MSLKNSLLNTQDFTSVFIIRFAVAAVFLSEGLQKFIRPEVTGVGRIEQISFVWPEVTAHAVGAFEIIFGLFVLFGFWTRLAVLPLITVMIVAIYTTKIPLLSSEGFWVAAHAARTDFLLFCSCLFLLIVGAGRLSLDWSLTHGRR